MKCQKCGKEIELKASFCPNCGAILNNSENESIDRANEDKQDLADKRDSWTANDFRPYVNTMPQNDNSSFTKNENRKWYQKSVFIILLLFLFFPAGLFLMWKYSDWKKAVKIAVTVIVAVVFLASLSDGGDTQGNNEDNGSSYSETEQSQGGGDKTNKESETTTKTTTTTTTTKKTLSENEYKNSCGTISFKDLSRNPDKYKGNKYKFTGEVVQAMEQSYFGNTVYALRINVTKGEYFWEDTIYATVVIDSGDDRILEDDIITIWGTCEGLYTYESVLGSSVSLPKIKIEYYAIQQ